MANEQITFDKLPQAVGYLTEQMEQIRQMVAALQPQASSDKHAGNIAPGTGSGDSIWSEAQTKGRL